MAEASTTSGNVCSVGDNVLGDVVLDDVTSTDGGDVNLVPTFDSSPDPQEDSAEPARRPSAIVTREIMTSVFPPDGRLFCASATLTDLHVSRTAVTRRPQPASTGA
jgi:hypothetical protein